MIMKKIGSTYQPRNESESTTTGTSTTTTTTTTKPIQKNSCWLQSFIPQCPFERFTNKNRTQSSESNISINHDTTSTTAPAPAPAPAPQASVCIFGMKKPSFHCERKKWRDTQKKQRCIRDRYCEKRRQQEDNEWEVQCQTQFQCQQQQQNIQSCSSSSNKRLCRQQSQQQQQQQQHQQQVPHCTTSFFKVPCTQSIFSQSTTSIVSSTSTSSSLSQRSTALSNSVNDNNRTTQQQSLRSSFESILSSEEFCSSQQSGVQVATTNFYVNNRNRINDSDSD